MHQQFVVAVNQLGIDSESLAVLCLLFSLSTTLETPCCDASRTSLFVSALLLLTPLSVCFLPCLFYRGRPEAHPRPDEHHGPDQGERRQPPPEVPPVLEADGQQPRRLRPPGPQRHGGPRLERVFPRHRQQRACGVAVQLPGRRWAAAVPLHPAASPGLSNDIRQPPGAPCWDANVLRDDAGTASSWAAPHDSGAVLLPKLLSPLFPKNALCDWLCGFGF